MGDAESLWSGRLGLMISIGVVLCRWRLVGVRVKVLFHTIEGNRSFSGRCCNGILQSKSGPSFAVDKSYKSSCASDMPIGQPHEVLVGIPASAQVHAHVPACIPFVPMLLWDKEINDLAKIWSPISGRFAMKALVPCHLVLSGHVAFGQEHGCILHEPFQHWMLAWDLCIDAILQ